MQCKTEEPQEPRKGKPHPTASYDRGGKKERRVRDKAREIGYKTPRDREYKGKDREYEGKKTRVERREE